MGYVCAPSLLQYAVKECIDVPSNIEAYRENRDLFYGYLTEMGYTVARPDGAFYLFMKALEPDAYAFCERAKKYELLLVPSDSFGYSGYVRLAYCIDKNTIERAKGAFLQLYKDYNG